MVNHKHDDFKQSHEHGTIADTEPQDDDPQWCESGSVTDSEDGLVGKGCNGYRWHEAAG